MHKFSILVLLAAAVAGCGTTEKTGASPQDDRPNIILVMTDDQGIGDLGVMGNPVIETPHLDRFAEQGVHMTTFYVSPVCAPTRAQSDDRALQLPHARD